MVFAERHRLLEHQAALEVVAQLADVARPRRPRQARDERRRAEAGQARLARPRGRAAASATSSGRSSGRSRSGGSTMRTTARRKNRSARKRPWFTSARRSRLVAAMTRTSTGRYALVPDARTWRFSSTRSSFGCSSSGSSPISSRKMVPPAASSNAPRPARLRAGERALLVAEQLALEQVGRDRAAVDDHERLVRARAGAVDRLRRLPLAGAGLALEQHGRVAGRRLLHQRERHARRHATCRASRRTTCDPRPAGGCRLGRARSAAWRRPAGSGCRRGGTPP